MRALKPLVRSAILLGLALAVQSLGLPAQITGIVINAVLLTAAILVHPLAGVAIGLFTPWVAIMTGIMALVFMAPYIMIANAALVLVFTLARRYGNFVGVISGAVAKYLTFIVAINFLLPIFGRKLPAPALVVFGVQQLVTAMAGGLIALVIAETINPIINK